MKLYLIWNENTIWFTLNVNDPFDGYSIKFTSKGEMISYLHKNKNQFGNIFVYDQISDGNNNFEWQLIDIKEI